MIWGQYIAYDNSLHDIGIVTETYVTLEKLQAAVPHAYLYSQNYSKTSFCGLMK